MIRTAPERIPLQLFYAFGAIQVLAVLAAFYFNTVVPALLPAAAIFIGLTIYDFRLVYFLLFVTIPLSAELELSGGFATDFPSEILMVVLMMVFLAYAFSQPDRLNKNFIRHPLITLLLLHYLWMLVTAFFSANAYVSLKFALAKTWYIVVFVFLSGLIVKEEKHFRKIFWCMVIPLIVTVLYTLFRHSQHHFSFDSVNNQMQPFFRNHVNYACMLALMIPILMLAKGWYQKSSFNRLFLQLTLALFLVAIILAFTRSAWLSLAVAAGAYVVVKLKWMKPALVVAFAAVIGFFIYMGVNYRYIDYAPEYETTIYHPELGDHLASTFEGADVSSAERIYRWVAGVRMWLDRPLTGFGPGNFYNFYKPYTVDLFKTYVSDNPEKSSIHNYFLLLMTEQGIIGLLIFIALTFFIFLNGQRIYHETKGKQEKRYVIALLCAITTIFVNTFLSDLLETDKIGALFFLCIALLVNQDLRNKKVASQVQTDPTSS